MPMYSLAVCGEMFDTWADVIEEETEYSYNVYMVGITLEDGMIMPIGIILN